MEVLAVLEERQVHKTDPVWITRADESEGGCTKQLGEGLMSSKLLIKRTPPATPFRATEGNQITK